MTTDIGFIGLGRMGGSMARNLAAAGYPVHIFDIDAAAVARLATVPGTAAQNSPGEVASPASVLFPALPNDQIVRDTYLGARGVLSGGRPGLVTCDCSTVSPQVSQEIHAAAAARGIAHMDTPMLGS